MKDVIDFIDQQRETFVDELVEFLKIPSVSTKPEHSADVRRAGEQVIAELKALDFKTEFYETQGHPIAYGEWLNAPGKPTVLFYGHYDVQPPEPLELWESEPFKPRIENGNIYARGSSDDKGQFYIHLKALRSLLKTRGSLPVNVKVLIEGEEEIGSPNLPAFIEKNKEMLSCDAVVVSDTAMWAPGVPALCYGLRGLLGVELELRGPNRDLHSGAFGGAVANPINQLCRIIARLHDEDHRVTIPGFYDDVLDVQDWERKATKKLNFDEKEYKKQLGVKALWGDKEYSAPERISSRPTLDCNGIWGGYQGPGAKTVLPSLAHSKITMRLVPKQDPKKILANLLKYLQEITPDSVELTVTGGPGGPAVLLPTSGPIIDSACAALKEYFGQEPVFLREGGSIPVVSTFDNVLGAPCVLLAFGLPDDNLHAPNEKFNLNNYHQGIKTVAHFLCGLGEGES